MAALAEAATATSPHLEWTSIIRVENLSLHSSYISFFLHYPVTLMERDEGPARI